MVDDGTKMMSNYFDEGVESPCYNKLSFLSKIDFLGAMIINSKIVDGDGESDVVITEYHQANNTILNLLEHAYNVRALEKMILKLCEPSRYQRRVAPPKAGNVKAAMGKLGDFTNTMFTMDELEKHKDCIKIKSSISSMGAFASQLTQSNDKYGRLGGNSVDSIRSFQDLVKNIRDGSIKS